MLNTAGHCSVCHQDYPANVLHSCGGTPTPCRLDCSVRFFAVLTIVVLAMANPAFAAKANTCKPSSVCYAAQGLNVPAKKKHSSAQRRCGAIGWLDDGKYAGYPCWAAEVFQNAERNTSAD